MNTIEVTRRMLNRCLVTIFALICGLSAVSATAREPVRSLLEMRRDKVIVQEFDISCGAAALATLLIYQHGDDVTEEQIALSLVQREEYIKNPDLIRMRNGFSLLDLKRYAERRGYEGIGFGQLTMDDLEEFAPIMIPVRFSGYDHFVIYRGKIGNRVLVADPAYGNRTMLASRLADSWISYPNIGSIGFVIARRDGIEPPNQLQASLSDFVNLR